LPDTFEGFLGVGEIVVREIFALDQNLDLGIYLL
jgi:hypothetical protein